MPNQPKTKVRTFRIPDDLYEAARAEAARNKESITDVVIRSLTRYVEATRGPRTD